MNTTLKITRIGNSAGVVLPKEVLAHLEKIGQPVKSHSSSIEEALADRVRTELSNGAKTEPEKAAPKAAASKATKKPA